MTGKKKKGNYETLKFLAVLAAICVIILVIYFISRGSEVKNPPIVVGNSATPLPTDNTPAPTKIIENTPAPTAATPTDTATPSPTKAAEPTLTPDPTDTPTPAPTNQAPTPAVAIKAAEAKKALETIVDPTVYSATLKNGSFTVDGEKYYYYSITDKDGKPVQPEMLVHAYTASVYCYQDGKVFDCVQFPLDSTESGGHQGNGGKEITASEAVKILMTYGRDQLQLPNDPSKYTAKVDDEPSITLADADGIQAYLILLVDKNDKLVGAYAVSVDGIFVYIRDELDPSDFIRITEG